MKKLGKSLLRYAAKCEKNFPANSAIQVLRTIYEP